MCPLMCLILLVFCVMFFFFFNIFSEMKKYYVQRFMYGHAMDLWWKRFLLYYVHNIVLCS